MIHLTSVYAYLFCFYLHFYHISLQFRHLFGFLKHLSWKQKLNPLLFFGKNKTPAHCGQSRVQRKMLFIFGQLGVSIPCYSTLLEKLKKQHIMLAGIRTTEAAVYLLVM